MPAQTVAEYLNDCPEDKRVALERLRERVLAWLPDAEECMSYGIPGYRENGKIIVGIAAYAHHLSWFPHSGRVLPAIAGNPQIKHLLDGYDWNKGTLRFPTDHALPDELIGALISIRREQAVTEKLSKSR